MTLKDRVLALVVEWTGLPTERLAAELDIGERSVLACCFQLGREGRITWGHGPAVGYVLLREPRPELAWPPEQPWTPAAGPVGKCVECGGWARTIDEARQPCHPNCGTGTGTASYDDAVALVADVLGGDVIADGAPRTPGPVVGPCASCRTTTRRYGPGAGPVCATCRAALPIDPLRRYLRPRKRLAATSRR